MNVTVKAAGTWLHSLGPVGDLTLTTSMRGPLAASWKMLLPVGFTHRALRQGARVEVYVGTFLIWSGTLAEPDRVAWEFTADGLHRLGETTGAMAEPVPGSFAPTTVIDDAIDAAIGRGLPWRRSGSISSTPLSTDSSDAANINTLTALLDKWCEVNGKEWMVRADGEVIAYDPPMTPRWALKPGVPALAVADDDYYSRVFVRYVSEVSGSPAEPSAWSIATAVDEDAAARWGAREEPFDMSDLGYLTTTQAQAVANALLTNGKTRPAFTQGIEVSIAQLTTLGGTSPAPWQVQAGQQGLTQYGVLTTDGGITAAGSLFWVIGGTEWTAGSRAITLTPRGLLPRTEASVIGAIAAATAKEFR